jgi:hypothetical protein
MGNKIVAIPPSGCSPTKKYGKGIACDPSFLLRKLLLPRVWRRGALRHPPSPALCHRDSLPLPFGRSPPWNMVALDSWMSAVIAWMLDH